MPIYDYHCSKCGHEFELVERISEHQRKHKCPKCRSEKVENVMTPFYAKTARKS